jgi:stage V sporulation protein K
MTNNLLINKEYITAIQQECKELLDLCTILNNSHTFLDKANPALQRTKQTDNVRAEHIILQDFINLYHRLVKADPGNNTPKSKFTLVYYYECLKRGKIIEAESVEKINALIQSQPFEANFRELALSVSSNFKTSFIASILSDINSDHSKQMNLHIYKYARFIANADDKANEEEELILTEILSKTKDNPYYSNDIENDTLELALADLNKLIGLPEAKETVKNIINFLTIQKAREKEKLPIIANSLHSVFIGPPGTGKTSVARILSRIYKHLGLLKKGHLIETDRAGLVAGYVGQTALKVEEVIKSALGGVLFIDEAYSLASNSMGATDYGKEALEILLKRMEDYREQFIVIVAGYPDEMKMFIDSNPGLKSRFNQYISFNHYTPRELTDIFKLFCSKYVLTLSADAEEKIADIFALADEKKNDSYGNAREARNLFEHTIRLQAGRLVNAKEINGHTLSQILEEDIPPVKETVRKITTDDV